MIPKDLIKVLEEELDCKVFEYNKEDESENDRIWNENNGKVLILKKTLETDKFIFYYDIGHGYDICFSKNTGDVLYSLNGDILINDEYIYLGSKYHVPGLYRKEFSANFDDNHFFKLLWKK